MNTAKSGRKPLSHKHEALKECAAAIEADKASKTIRDLVYMPRIFVSTTLPLTEHGATEYKRRDGKIRLAMTAGDDKQLPCGIFPRQILMWICTQVVTKKQRNLCLGGNYAELLRTICSLDSNHKPSDYQRKSIKEQFDRLLTTVFEIKDTRNGGEVVTPFEIAEGCDFWEKEDLDERGIITLTPEFYELAKSSIPFDHAAIRALGSSAFQIDVFMWLTARIARIKRTMRTTHDIPYQELYEQFGTRQKHKCDFRREFLHALKTISMVWPHFRYSSTKKAIAFNWSNTLVPRMTNSVENEYELGVSDTVSDSLD